ncbi:UDP-glucose dehydrogenase family protein [Balneatrix alpica]|uniref:UDP-glucose 6-dehydrogenase n=1 Tax=Balneatrix alpica TaxID=75684 RepID=A0ABV5ZE14_9GAMM|nr:nucleotide sugar dehydrogenase [Balneatrix alpica]
MKISVYGLTLNGVVAAVSLAYVGNDVHLVPLPGEHADENWRRTLEDEPGLLPALNKEQLAGRLQVGAAAHALLPGQDVHWLAPEPDAHQWLPDWLCAHELADAPLLIVNQTTAPVGTCEHLQQVLSLDWQRRGYQQELAVVAMPDFIRQGAALANFQRPDCILLGVDAQWPQVLMRDILRPFNRNRDTLMVMSSREAEFTKYVVNGMLATKLSFMNEMANLAETLGVDIERVRQGVGADRRIGPDYIYPGCGFGGASFSADIITLAEQVSRSGSHSNLLGSVLNINEQQKEVLFRKLWQHFNGELQGRRVAIWGAAFKPNTASIRNAPIHVLLKALWAQGCQVAVHDPMALESLRAHYGDRPDLCYSSDPYQVTEGADALMLVTEWKDYWSPDYQRLLQQMSTPLILDGRNIYEPQLMQARGFIYRGIGRG